MLRMSKLLETKKLVEVEDSVLLILNQLMKLEMLCN
jgi:hypothetical protein